MARLRTATATQRDRRVVRGLTRARHIVHVKPERVTDAVREERRAHARREQRRLVCTVFEDP